MNSIRTKIFVYFFIPVIATAATYFALTEFVLKRHFIEEHKREALVNVQRLTNSIKNSIINKKTEDLTQYIFDEKESELNVEYVVVFDEFGRVLAHTFLGDLPEQVFSWNNNIDKATVYEQTLNKKNILSVDNPIMIGLHKIGVIKVGYDNQKTEDNFMTVFYSYIILGTLSLVLCVFSVLRLSKSIISPVEELIIETTEFSGGKFEKRSNVSTNDEIGKLASVFNEMADSLAENKKIIEKEAEASRERIEELESWQKNTVGRELRMIELKEKIKKLEAERESLVKKV